MGLRGPVGKSPAAQALDGNTGHRTPAVRVGGSGLPERPKGLTAAARRKWDEYIELLVALGTLRPADGPALGRLCQAVADLEEHEKGLRNMASDLNRKWRQDAVRLKAITEQLASAEGEARGELLSERQEIVERRIVGNAVVAVASSHEGRRIQATINAFKGQIARLEMQFGLTPASAARVESNIGGGYALPAAPVDDLEMRIQ